MKNLWHADRAQIADLCREITALEPNIVLDIGGNHVFRLPVATHSVGWEGDLKLDLARDRLPFNDQSVDYVYSRHTIEDLADPTHILSEIRRVAKRGFLETPSALCEITRGVDACGSHMGFSHHRWMCYSDQGTFTCLAKYPCVELLDRFLPVHVLVERNLRHQFDGPLEYRVIQNEQGFKLSLYDEFSRFPAQYYREIGKAIGVVL